MTSAGKGRPTGREPFPPDARLPGTDKNRDQSLSLRLPKAPGRAPEPRPNGSRTGLFP